MSWAESVRDRTGRPSRPSRPNYVPPHLRNNRDYSYANVTKQYPPERTETESFPFGGRFGRSRSTRGGRGRGRGGHRQYYDNNMNSNMDPFSELVEKFDELEVIEESDVNGGINFDAYDDIPVEATGSDVPPPVNTFAEIDLGKALNDNIRRCKYVKPTPVQRHAIPIAVAGRDLMACAQTGSGKTAAFCFPIICGILKSHVPAPAWSRGQTIAQPLALILSPTRELSCQIYEEAKKFSYQTGVKIVVAYGGAPISQQFRNLEKGVDILVATPGRLVDMIERQRVSLQMIKYLALDEADRMLDMGFEPQIRKIVERMDMPPRGSRQTLLFSATFPTEIQRLASDFLSNYIFLAVGRVGSSTDLISQKVEFVQEMDKRNFLMDLLHGQNANGSHKKLSLTLVFVETKRGADALECWLSRNGFPAIAIHGDKVQMERERALKSFKSGLTPVLVATDVASRGLDIPHVAHVINFDLPKDIDDYVHRIGRTGRAGKSGLATAFFSDKNMPLAKSLAELMQEANQEVPSWLSEYAETNSGYVSASRGRRYSGSNFGGRDFRSNNTQFTNGGDHDYYVPYADDNSYSAAQSSFSYAFPVDTSYPTPGVDSHAGGPYEYGFDHGTVVASGWDASGWE